MKWIHSAPLFSEAGAIQPTTEMFRWLALSFYTRLVRPSNAREKMASLHKSSFQGVPSNPNRTANHSTFQLNDFFFHYTFSHTHLYSPLTHIYFFLTSIYSSLTHTFFFYIHIFSSDIYRHILSFTWKMKKYMCERRMYVCERRMYVSKENVCAWKWKYMCVKGECMCVKGEYMCQRKIYVCESENICMWKKNVCVWKENVCVYNMEVESCH